MQFPTCTYAWSNRRLRAASRSMCGVVPGSLQPYTPTESQLMSSVVTIRTFGFGAAGSAAVSNRKTNTKNRAGFGAIRHA